MTTETNLRFTVSEQRTSQSRAIHKVSHASGAGVHTQCGSLLAKGQVYYREPPVAEGLHRCPGCYKGDGNGKAPGWHERLVEALDEADGTVLLGAGIVHAVLSHSEPMTIYYVIHLPDELVCTCKGFRYRGSCAHRSKVVESLGQVLGQGG